MTANFQQDGQIIPAQVTGPSYFLQRKIGGPASRAINPLSIARAEAALIEMLPALEGEIFRLVTELQRIVASDGPNIRNLIWKHAHELRGMAGTVAKVRLGEAANTMCLYLHGTEPDFQPDPKVLSTIAVIVLLAVKEGADADPMVETLLADSLKAVHVQRNREGRPPV